jgi:hypothetical protein
VEPKSENILIDPCALRVFNRSGLVFMPGVELATALEQTLEPGART